MDGTELVTRLPLSRLHTPRGEATRVGNVGAAEVRYLLRTGRVRFLVADVGRPVHWVPEVGCFDFWKCEVRQHLAGVGEVATLNQYPGEYAYVASRWDDGATPIILLAKTH